MRYTARMKLFFRALLLAVLGVGAIGAGVLWTAFSAPTITDPQSLAIQVFFILGALVFGAYALLQAQDDYIGYRKANKKPNKALNAMLILLAVLVLAFAGYKAWQSTQPIHVTLTYLNGTTNEPITGATLYYQSSMWNNGNKPPVKSVVTDAEGQTRFDVSRDSYYSIYEKPPGDAPGGATGQIEPYGVSGLEYELFVYAGERLDSFGTPHDTYTVTVIDKEGQFLDGATVRFYTSSGTVTEAQTNDSGQAQVEDNSYGPISVFVSKDGYQSAIQKAENGVLTLVMLTPSN